MRKHLEESELIEIATKIADTIVIRTMDGGTSHDKRRKTTGHEMQILRDIAFGALLALNYGETFRREKIAEDAIIETAEFILDLQIPSANGYDSIYNPLRRAVKDWPEE